MLGVAGMQAANISGLTPQQSSKWWSVSASLRGFYDDNVSASYSKESSPGMEFEPSFSVNLPRERTLLTAKYVFRLNYYADRPQESTDYHHMFNLRLNHRFTPRYTLNVEDAFVYSNEPQVIAGSTTGGGNVPVGYGRANGSAVRNIVPVDFTARISPLIGVNVGYRNTFLDYEDHATAANPYLSRSSLLDRVENSFHVDGDWYFTETTIAFVGYEFSWLDFTSSDQLFPGPTLGSRGPTGAIRNSRSHAAYVGASHQFSQQLNGRAKVGIEATDSYRLHQSDVSPYVDLTGTYAYLPGSSVQLGVKVGHQPTDLVGSDGDVTRNQLASVIYGEWTHRITPRIAGHLSAQYLYSIFNGGPYDGDTEGFFNLGLSFDYRINNYLSATLAYTFDVLSSNADDKTLPGDESKFREFDRNRIWAGITATY